MNIFCCYIHEMISHIHVSIQESPLPLTDPRDAVAQRMLNGLQAVLLPLTYLLNLKYVPQLITKI